MRRAAPWAGIRRSAAVLAALGLLAGGCGSGSTAPASATGSTSRSSPSNVQEVDVGGYRLDVECEGEGSPSVVFEAGAGGDRSAFADQVSAVGEITRVCAYDRAGIGTSDERPATGSTTLGDLADELAQVLEGAGVDQPIVLVSHSLGGGVAQFYADRHADRVAGLVFVDSIAIPGYTDWFGPEVDDGTGGSVDMGSTTTDWDLLGDFGSTPNFVLTQGFAGEDSSAPQDFRLYFRRVHDDLAARSTNSIHLIATNSGHNIHETSPGLVTAAITEVVQAVRSGEPLAPCDDRFEGLAGACA